MKKLIAILLSVLMLCSVIPFAAVSVSAADDYYIEIVADAEEVNAGDEVAIEVSFYGHEGLGLIGAIVELGFDPDVFELVTYYDEDEEMWMPPIEVGSKFNASSNKYITFAPIDEETGYMERCLVTFLRATASASQAVKTNLYYTVTFKVKDDAPSGTYEIDFINYNKKNIIQYGNAIVDWTWEPAVITVNGTEAPSCEHEYEYDCSKNCSKCGEETRPEADHAYFYPCDANCMYCYELTNENAAHSENHVDAVEATCQVNGNIEYWYCSDCGASWDVNGMPVNRFTVITFGEHVYTNPCDAHCAVCGELTNEEAAHTIVAVDAKAPTCTEAGNVAYWYCSDCGAAWLDAECTIITNQMAVKLGATCSTNAIHSEGVEPGCHYTGWTENWYCANCDVYYLDAACTIITNYKSLTIPALQDSAEYVPAKDATCYENGNVEYWVCYECEQVWADAALTQLTNIKNVQIAPAHTVEYVAAVAPGCENEGNVEYWYCTVCGAAWLDAECTLVTNLMSVKLPITHNVIHVEAKDATCFELGNIEYWYCTECGAAWLDEYCHLNTNLMAVVLPISHNIIHVEAVEASCYEPGNIEYWYCDACGSAWTDELCREVTNLKNVVLPIAHNVEYVAAKAATCDEPGNIEYWYCTECGSAWTDELCREVTNLKNVVLPIAHNVIYVAAKDATCTELGNIEYWYCDACGSAWLDEYCHLNTNLKAVVLPAAGHVYTNAHDASCDVCGETREIVLGADEIILPTGKSIRENIYGTGLAFKFDAYVDGIVINQGYLADYTNATVTIGGVEYKLVGMGAIVNNKSLADQTLENVDGSYVLNVAAEKVFEDEAGNTCYAVRILNIPEANYDTEIIARSYYQYECEGKIITVYGDNVSASYNAVLNG